MTQHDPTTGHAAATITCDELHRQYGSRWNITFEQDRRTWSAEQRSPDGRQRRYITEHSPAELARRLATAEAAAR
jgi:hypothetical protein